MEACVIAVNLETSDVFKEFATENSDYMTWVEHRSFSGMTELAEFIVKITPECLAALSAFLIARIKRDNVVIVQKGDLKIELRNTDLSPKETLELLQALEEKNDEE